MSAEASPSTPSSLGAFLDFVRAVLDEKRATDVVVLDLRGISSLADQFIIATVTNPRQASAVVAACEKERKARKLRCIGIEGEGGSSWVVLDYGDIVVHLFMPEAREYYGLEHLWADAERIE